MFKVADPVLFVRTVKEDAKERLETEAPLKFCTESGEWDDFIVADEERL